MNMFQTHEGKQGTKHTQGLTHKPVHSSDKTSSERCRTEIETEFPVNGNMSPKMKHVSVSTVKSLDQMSRSAEEVTRSRSFSGNRESKSKHASSQQKSVINPKLHHKNSSSESDAHYRKSLSQSEHFDRNNPMSHSVRSTSSAGSGVSKVSQYHTRERASSASSIPIKRGQSNKQSALCSAGSYSKLSVKSRTDSGLHSNNTRESQHHHSNRDSPQHFSTNHKSGNGPTTSRSSTSEHSVRDRMAVLKETLGSPPRVPLLPSNSHYFYDYSDEDSDFNRPVSCDFSTTSTVSLNEILDSGEDTDTLLDADFSSDKFAFFDTPPYGSKARRHRHKDGSKPEEELMYEHGNMGLRGKPDIVKDIEYSEMKNQTKSPHVPRKRCVQHPPSKRKHSSQRPSSLILAPREKQFAYTAYSSSSSSLESSDCEEHWSQHRKSHSGGKPTRSKPRSHHAHSLSPSSSVPRKSSVGEVTPSDSGSPSPKLTTISNENISVSSSNNSLTKKKGPPPPVPVKPASGRRSPGIRMGTQSPGFKFVKKESLVQEFKIADDNQTSQLSEKFPANQMSEKFPANQMTTIQVFSQTDHILTSTPIKSTPEIEKKTSEIPKCSSSDLSLDGVKIDKVERSGSKDDGYSTMSSDIQPEAMDKFGDGSFIKRDSPITRDSPPAVKIEEEQSPPESKVKDSKSGHDLTSDLDSAMDTSLHSVELRNSNHSLSSNSSEDRAIMCGSLGRVRAMKMLFEAEKDKPTDFKLRKSPSLDSKLCNGKDIHPSRNLNRRSLDANFKVVAEQIFSHSNINMSKSHEEVTERRHSDSTVINNVIPGLDDSMDTCDDDEDEIIPTLAQERSPVFQHVQVTHTHLYTSSYFHRKAVI